MAGGHSSQEQQCAGQPLPLPAEGLSAVSSPHPGLHADSSWPANSTGLQRPSSKLLAQVSQSRFLLFAISIPDTTIIGLGWVTILLNCNDSQVLRGKCWLSQVPFEKELQWGFKYFPYLFWEYQINMPFTDMTRMYQFWELIFQRLVFKNR